MSMAYKQSTLGMDSVLIIQTFSFAKRIGLDFGRLCERAALDAILGIPKAYCSNDSNASAVSFFASNTISVYNPNSNHFNFGSD
jgi:hypothetical protein